jgi:hypothetical protein
MNAKSNFRLAVAAASPIRYTTVDVPTAKRVFPHMSNRQAAVDEPQPESAPERSRRRQWVGTFFCFGVWISYSLAIFTCNGWLGLAAHCLALSGAATFLGRRVADSSGDGISCSEVTADFSCPAIMSARN